MAQDLQIISNGLEKSPFNRKTSILDLDALNGQPALQFLSDIFGCLDPVHAGSISEEAPQETALRFFMFLRLVRYPSPEDPEELSIWRQDVVEGKRRTILPILLWILRNLTMVQQRIYLSKYMTKIDVSPELRADSEINQICEEQDRAVAEFASVHKFNVQLKADADIVKQYRQEIKDLRSQKDQTEGRVKDLLSRIRAMPGKSAENEERMTIAHQLREEREKCSKLMDKRTELIQMAPSQTDQIARLKDYTSKMTNDWLEMTPEKLLKALQDRLTIQRRAVDEVLPKVIADEKVIVSELRSLAGIPDFSEKSLNELRIKAQMLQSEVFNLSDKLRRTTQGPEQAQITVYRGQMDTAANKKRELTSRNDATYREIRNLEKQLKISKGIGDQEEANFQSLSVKLMQTSEDFEKKKQQIKALQIEGGDSLRSNAILAAENDRIRNVLTEWEKRTGLSPFVTADQSLRGVSMKTGDVVALAEQVRNLEKRSATKRAEASELLTELQPMREKRKRQDETLAREKSKEDRSGDSSLAIEKKVTQLRQELWDLEDRLSASQIHSQYSQILMQRADDAKSDDKFANSLISTTQKETLRLQQLQSTLSDARKGHAENSRQATAWRDLEELFDVKAEHLRQDLELAERRVSRLGSADAGWDRIVMS